MPRLKHRKSPNFDSIEQAEKAGFSAVAHHASGGSYLVTLEGHVTGMPGQSGGLLRAYGNDRSQEAAEEQALAALNQQLRHFANQPASLDPEAEKEAAAALALRARKSEDASGEPQAQVFGA